MPSARVSGWPWPFLSTTSYGGVKGLFITII